MPPRRFARAALLLGAALGASAQPPSPPFPAPARPAPTFSWATIPLAFHGANTSGLYDAAAVAQLSRYNMVTIEKWYTPCGAQHPSQSGPDCDVEDKMYATFAQLKASASGDGGRNLTTILYLNTMFDFAFYRLNGIVEAREAAGERLLLRDERGAVVRLCNDGDHYCGVSFFDHSLESMRALWMEAVRNATASGSVDGVFGDHATQRITPGGGGGAPATLCNGKPLQCWNFTDDFAAAFNLGHAWLVNATQDMLSRLPGAGPIIDGPYGAYDTSPCNFTSLRARVLAGRAGDAAFVIEASAGGCTPDESCMANFLCAAEEFTYLSCLSSGPVLPPFLPEYGRALGAPTGPPVEAAGVVTRSFRSSAGLTTARVDLASGSGTIAWAAGAV